MIKSQVLGSLLAASALCMASVLPAAAQSAPPPQNAAPSAVDRMDLVKLTVRQPSADAPADHVQFEATVNYRLQSVDSGFVLLFLFENDASDSSQQSSEAIDIQRGTGQLVLDINYTLKPDVRTLTLVAGEFRPPQKLLSWVSTNPIDMAPWPGRVAFEHAMTARLAGDWATAEQDLTQALSEAPTTGNYYYWRGDTRIRLNDYSDALADFDQSLQLMPNDRPSHVGRGIANLWLGNTSDAVSDLSFVIDSATAPDRSSAWAYRARGVARASLGQSDDAVADYQQYLALTPNASDKDQIEGWIQALAPAGP
jgi:tetratricopeptide (TPR) repeat protein